MFHRFIAKLGGNFVGMLIAVIRLGLVARFLGPEAYGRFEFLCNFFVQSTSFLDMGTSTCFYTKLSQRQMDRGLVRFYAWFVAGVCALLLISVAWLTQISISHQIWAGESVGYILLAAVLGCLMWWHQVVQKVVDAYGLTVKGELFAMASKGIMLVVLVLLVLGGWLSLGSYLVFQIASIVLGIALWAMLVSGSTGARITTDVYGTPKEYAKEFWGYSHPLLVASLLGVIMGLFERWLLQTQAGATQQGFFGLANQIGTFCFMFTGAMAPLMLRDFAIAWERNDRAGMARMFSRYLPVFYVLASFFSVFVACRASDIVWVVGGHGFADGTAAVAIMALYPIHQTYGQLSGSIFYATGQTRQYRNIGIIGQLIGLPLSLWILMPVSKGGLGMGASGLAIRMLLLQVVMVNVQLWFCARLLDVSFRRLLGHQIRVPVAFVLCSWTASIAEGFIGAPRFSGLIFSGAVYCLLALGGIVIFPRFFGIDREDLLNVSSKVTALLRFNR